MVLKGNTPVKWTYNIQENLESKSGEYQKYFKGLGTWSPDLLEYIINKDTFEKMCVKLNFDNLNIMNEFLSSDESDSRKEYIKNHKFSIANL